jgi:hypothetical protein
MDVIFSITGIESVCSKTLKSRTVRKFLFAYLISCHAALTLCGLCLHELPGATHHRIGASSRTDRSDDPLRARGDSSDSCLICQFVAQGQLPVEFSTVSSPQVIADSALYTRRVSPVLATPLASSPRAPPMPCRDVSFSA